MQLRTYLEKGDHAIQLWLRIEQNRTEGHGSWRASPFFMRDKSLPRKAGKGYERGALLFPPSTTFGQKHATGMFLPSPVNGGGWGYSYDSKS